MNTSCRHLYCITPPHLLRKLLESKDKEIRDSALRTLLASATIRGERNVRSLMLGLAPAAGRRTVYDCRRSTDLGSATVARSEDGPASADASVNRAFDGLGTTRQFYKEVLKRNSIDDEGLRLEAFVHFDRNLNNAFWDGSRMLFGDGDGQIFTDLTKSLDVIGHELAHGVTQYTAGLEYRAQPGALNESMSDVFGSLIKQWSLGQTAAAADWLIGADVFTPDIKADALRSMRAPGTAYKNHPDLGSDPQPDHMDRYDHTMGDNQGVHINSGIPNKAFYETAIAIGGNAWEAPGQIWYKALRASVSDTNFQQFANTTFLKAGEQSGANSREQRAVRAGWEKVGIEITVPTAVSFRDAAATGRGDDDCYASLKQQIEALSAQVKALAKEVEGQGHKGRK
jgi:Zn-dependent metalloprotease